MTDFKVGSIVRIVKQPADVLPKIVGEVGFIDSLHENGTHAGFNGLKVDGSISGCGTVMLDCLAPEPAPHWAEAKRLYDERIAKLLEESRACSERISAGIAIIAKKRGVSVEEAVEIHREVEKVIERAGWPEEPVCQCSEHNHG